MKEFFKMMFASLLGFIIFNVLLFVVFLLIVIGVAATSMSDSTPVKTNSLLVLDLNGTIAERSVDMPFAKYMNTFNSSTEISLQTIVENIKKAKNDDNIAGISLDIENISASMATLEEIRNTLLDFKESGKFIYCYADVYSQPAYYLASVADKVFFNPQGTMLLKGLSSQIMFYKNMLKKLDVDIQVVKVGTYKSAVEPYILESMSDANREQMNKLLFSLWDNISAQICESRSMDINTFKQACDELSVFADNEKALQLGFVDSLIYVDQYISFLKKEMNIDSNKNIEKVTLKRYKNIADKTTSSKKDKIAVLYAVGNIIDGAGDNTTIGDNIAQELTKLRKDSTIKAIVLRINSGGGSALASENIWREVVETKKLKPIVVSMSDVAASGGYYIACAANYIVAQPNTITGSIGVFGIIPNVKSFMNNKLGVNVDVVSTNKHGDFMGIYRPMNDEERMIMQNSVAKTYKTFLTRVANGRNLSETEVDKIGQGRVWSGIDALNIGLVDTLGGLDVALEKAAELAKIKEYSTKDYPVLKDFYTELSESMFKTMLQKRMPNSYMEQVLPYLNTLETVSQMKGIQARLPYDIIIK